MSDLDKKILSQTKGNRIENLYIFIDGMPVQFMPSTTSELYHESIKNARRITVKGIPTKVVSVEYLVALLLTSFRYKDKIRIVELLDKVDRKLLDNIVGRFDDGENSIQARFQKLLTTV